MAFRSAQQSEPASHKAAAARPRSTAKSVISSDMEITGNVTSLGDIEVNGVVAGDIGCHSLIIGQEARVTGQVVAEAVEVRGRLDGQIRAESVSLTRSAHVTGEILHQSLAVEAGAHLEAKARRLNGVTGNGKTDSLTTVGHAGNGDADAVTR